MDEHDKHELTRRVPKVDRLAGHEALGEARRRLGEGLVTRLARELAAEVRHAALAGETPPALDEAARLLAARAEALWASRARRVINATGVVLHTNLGRAPLSEAAVSALAESAGGYTSIELDLASGRRGRRGAFAELALRELCGAEDALCVNNNAAAVLLVLTALAQGQGVVVSRGELVEIGGGFRVPEVLARSGARMIEVGTTNKTRLEDYRRAVDEDGDVALFLRVHRGNFKMSGFVEQPDLGELARLSHELGLHLVHDLGGGALFDLEPRTGLGGEPVARSCVEAGADLVCFSGDKVLGGPQAGVIVGSHELVERARRDPLARAVRLGRLPLVALEATLTSYLAGDLDAIPGLRAMSVPAAEVRARVAGWCERLRAAGVEAEPVEVEAMAGGGALSDEPMPSWAAWVACPDVDEAARRLRTGDPPVMPRVHTGRLLFDGRTVLARDDEPLCAAITRALGGS